MSLLNKLHPFFTPESIAPKGGGITAIASGSMGKEDIIEFLGGDDDTQEEILPLDKGKKEETNEDDDDDKDDKKLVPRKSKDKTEDDEEEDTDDNEDDDEELDELAELESELEEPTEEQLELVTPVRRQEILKKYPKIFKDFPYLEKAYYREQQFTEVFPTINDAKEANEKSEILDRFESDLMNGDTEKMLKAAQTNPKSFAKLVDNYMINLAKVDKDAHIHVIGNIIKHTIVQMANEAKRSDNAALNTAAALLNQFVFGTSEFVPPQNLAVAEPSPTDEKESRLTAREREFQQKRLDNATSDLDSRINNTFKATIEAHIDPRDTMSEYVKKTASREALENLEALVSADKRFKVLVDKLWEASIRDDFSKPSLERIRSAFLSKARTLLPSVIKKARNEALKGMGKRVREDNDDNEPTSKRSPKPKESPRSQSTNSSGRNHKPAKEVPRGMSTLEYLMSDDD